MTRYNSNKEEETHDKILYLIKFAKEHLSEEQYNEFIYHMYTSGIDNVFIEETPIYEDIMHQGSLLARRIKGTRYRIWVKGIKGIEVFGSTEEEECPFQ